MPSEKNEFEFVELPEGILSYEPGEEFELVELPEGIFSYELGEYELGEEVDDNILVELPPNGIKMYEFRDYECIELVEEEHGYVQDDGNIPITFLNGIKMFVPIENEPIDDDPIFDQKDNGQENLAFRSRR